MTEPGTHRVSLDAVVDAARVPLAADRLSAALRQLTGLDASSLALRVTDERTLPDDDDGAYTLALRWRPEPDDDLVTFSLPAPRDEHEARLRLTVSRAAWASQGEPGTVVMALDAPLVAPPQPPPAEPLPPADEPDEPGEHALDAEPIVPLSVDPIPSEAGK